MQKIMLQIPEPCQESWDQMQNCSDGKFCQTCAKSVIDFSHMTDEQVLRIVKEKKSGLCGRFDNQQLNRILEEQKKKTSKKWLALMAGISLLTPSEKADASNTSFAEVVHMTHPNADLSVGEPTQKCRPSTDSTPNTIKGMVIDDKGAPVAFASVMLKGTKIGVATNAEGYFELNLHDTNWISDSLQLQASAIGYITDIRTLKKTDITEGLKLTLAVRELEITVGAIVTMRKRKWWQLWLRKYH